MQQIGRRPVVHAPDGPEEGGEGLVVEDDDDAGVGQGGAVLDGPALVAAHVGEAAPQADLVAEDLAGRYKWIDRWIDG